MEYTVLKSKELYDNDLMGYGKSLNGKVKEFIENGWVPQGGVSTMYQDTKLDYSTPSGGITKFKPNVEYLQAMIKHSRKGKF